MGAEVAISSDASEIAVAAALRVVAVLEARWSRFRDDSELSRLNRSEGPAIVRPSTARIIEVALAGRRLTCGWFDPTRGADLAACGYRESHDAGWAPSRPRPDRLGDVDLDPESGLIHVPNGVAIDLGGIAKGWAADTAVALLRRSGATHAGVTLGGDVRISADSRALVEVEAPDAVPGPAALVGLRDGGVAVSGPTRRRTADGRHHLIDPRTGRPAATARVAAVISATAAGAEMLATAAAIAPRAEAEAIVAAAGATAWLIDDDGTRHRVGEPERFLLDHGWLG